MIITVSNYDKYQNPDNYEYRKSATRSKTVVQQPYDTINKNGKKEKNKYIAYVFDVYKKYVDNRVELTKEVEEAIDVVLSRYSREDLVGLIKYKAGDEFFQENNTKRGCTWFFGNGKFGQWMEEYKLAIKK
ncbi:MAG: hypothetical protein HQ530_05665 [Parcubacteria group bacterium]|nr:hypothetical protein [Parcubacteria group bacterium]